jgi:hypothetical protein
MRSKSKVPMKVTHHRAKMEDLESRLAPAEVVTTRASGPT